MCYLGNLMQLSMKRSEFLRSLLAGSVAAVVPAITALAAAPAIVSSKSIKLCTPFIAGFQYYKGEAHIDELLPGDSLTLVREPKNLHDRFAIKVYKGHLKLGYIPRADNKVIARMMDQKVQVLACVRFVDPDEDTYRMVRINVFYLSPVTT
jgi:hypothetical protein